jgi:UDP-N-acetylmuramoyl-L-alanyl-D-glutamate--2,6-diaminopimelate ligase
VSVDGRIQAAGSRLGRAESDTRGARRFEWKTIEALGISRLASDSRQVVAGDTFVAYPGETRDGRDFIPHALERGASSVLWERRDFAWQPTWKVKNAPVENLRRHAGEIASKAYGNPSSRLWVVGVTGTNGKTSCSHWIAQALTRMQRKCGIVGTLGAGWPAKLEPVGNTTPDAVWLQGRLRDFVRQRAQAISMEMSSHGLVQDRVSAVEVDVALLTNVTRDHLDYHGTMRSYRNAKARLFRFPSLKHAVLNLDDRFGSELVLPTRRRGIEVLGYGFVGALPPALRGRRLPRLVGRNLRMGSHGLSFEVTTPWGRSAVESRLIGRFNAANLLGTLAVLLASESRLEECITALQKVAPVPGRTERHGGGRRPLVVVDYAHTPDALENVLRALRELMSGGKLVCVFGCGGDRDRGKRPLMGCVASALADHVIVTSDNPRSENPRAIIEDVLEGIPGDVTVIDDRTHAIHTAIAAARAGDVVLVAGKGHEQHQEIDGVKHPYSDSAVVRAALGERAR